MKRSLIIGLILAAGALFLVSVVVFKRYLPYASHSLGPKQPPPVVLEMENTYLVGSGNHGKLWSVKAKKVELTRNRSFATLSGITDGKIFDQGKVALKVKAGSAIYNLYAKNLQLSGGMLIEGNNGQKVTGCGATWNSSTSTLRSIGQVCFETKESKILTDKLLVDVRNKELSMWNVKLAIDAGEMEKQFGQEAGNAQ